MRHATACLSMLLVSACATPTPYVAPAAAGKPGSEVSKLVAASDAKLFPCSIVEVKGANGADAGLGGAPKSEVTLPAGQYRVTLLCASAQHSVRPQANVAARAGKSYRLTGYFIDDSITIFNMKMAVRVAELQ